jgi:hypothetical protein
MEMRAIRHGKAREILCAYMLFSFLRGELFAGVAVALRRIGMQL